MSIIKKILIPFNFSETSRNAVNYALHFSNDKKEIQLNLVHISSEENKQEIKQSLQRLADDYQRQTESKVMASVIEDELASGIAKKQKSWGADLIIMGTRGSQHEEDTNTSQLIRNLDCAFISVPSDFKKFKLKRIAVSLGKDKIDDPNVLNVLLDIARRFASNVSAITILENMEKYLEIDEGNEKLLGYYLEKLYSHHSLLKNSDIEKGIFTYVKEHKIDLLAILPRHHSKKNVQSDGKLVNVLAKHAQIPLLVLD